MKKVIRLSLMGALGLGLYSSAIAGWDTNFSWPPSFRGWAHPATGGVLHSHDDFLFNAASYNTYKGNDGRDHAGIDFALATGTSIKAIGEGTVLYARTTGTLGSVVIVEHRTDDRYGNKFCAIYGHIKPSVSKGKWVTRGQTLGTVMSGSEIENWEPHLHFGINTDDDSKMCNGEVLVTREGKIGWGRVPLKLNPTDYEFENPLPFLNAKRNAQGR